MNKFELIKSFHFLLNEALNGNYFARITQVTFPITKKILLEELHLEAIKCINEAINNKFNPVSNKEVLQLLLEAYQKIQELNPSEGSKKSIGLNQQRINWPPEISKILYSVNQNALERYATYFGIQGSYSSNDYMSNISDVDPLIILNDNAFSTLQNLIEVQTLVFRLKQNLFKVDILQHHGAFILTNNYFTNYPQSFYPICLFDLTSTFYRRTDRIDFNILDDKYQRKKILLSTLNYLKKIEIESLNFYSFKVFFQVIQLLPISYLQGELDIFTGKKESFTRINDFFPEFKEFNNDLLKIRNNWTQPSSIPVFNYPYSLFIKKFKKPPVELKNQLSQALTKHNFNALLNKMTPKNA